MILMLIFSSQHDNYFTAWRYTTKEDPTYIESPNHPDLTNAQPPQTSQATTAWRTRSRRMPGNATSKKRKRLLSVYEVSQIAVRKNFTTRLELLAFAEEQRKHSKTDLAQFIDAETANANQSKKPISNHCFYLSVFGC